MSSPKVDANHTYSFTYYPTYKHPQIVKIEYDASIAKVVDIKKLIAKQIGKKPENINIFGRYNFGPSPDNELFEKVSSAFIFPAWFSVMGSGKEKKEL